MLGALLTGLCAAVRRIETVRRDNPELARLSRMADFEKWSYAAAPGLGWQPGAINLAYARNQSISADAAFESDMIAPVVEKWLVDDGLIWWEDRPGALIEALARHASDSMKALTYWPRLPQQIGNAMARAEPVLARRGIKVIKRHSGGTLYTITRTPKPAP